MIRHGSQRPVSNWAAQLPKPRRAFSIGLCAALFGVSCACPAVGAAGGDLPDIASVPADLEVPALQDGPPRAGLRVWQTAPGWEETAVYHVVYLPRTWRSDRKWPVVVEWPGNGGFRNAYGDECTGRPEGCKLGYGITAGEGAIWIGMPFVNGSGTAVAEKWWGDPPAHDPQPTLTYLRATLADVLRRYSGDATRVILAGFSRGSIAVNALGLHDDETAKHWRAFVCYSHYDGVRERWPFFGADRVSASARLARLRGRPQFICGEQANSEETQRYLQSVGILDTAAARQFTFVATGFRNHNDAWVLRPSAARIRLRDWFKSVAE